MGMAASQARYLALTARKTNTEWEGQQINQARTALSNQSAGLFNRLLGMEVPNAPKTTDYTKVQYSYSDGENESVFEDWHQINVADPNYNYVVSHYYMADIFTGIKRLLQDPQVQIGDVINELDYGSNTTIVTKDGLNNINVNYKINGYPYDQKYSKITESRIKTDSSLKSALTKFEKAENMLRADGSLVTDGVYGYKDADKNWHFFVAYDYNKIHESDVDTTGANNLKKSLELYENENDLYTSDPEFRYDGIYKTQDADGNWSFINIDDYKQLNKNNVENSGNKELQDALYAYEAANGLLNEHTSLRYDTVYGKQDADGNWSFMNTIGYNPVTRGDINSSNEFKTALYNYEKENDLLTIKYDTVYGKEDLTGNWDFVNIDGFNSVSEDMTQNEKFKLALTNYEEENNLLNPDSSLSYDNIYFQKAGNDKWEFRHTVGYSQMTQEEVQSGGEALKSQLTDYEYNNNIISVSPNNVYSQTNEDGTWSFINTSEYQKMTAEAVNSSEALKNSLTEYETNENLLIHNSDLTYDNIYGTKDADGNWNFSELNKYTKVRPSDIDGAKESDLANALKIYETQQGIIEKGGDLVYDNIYGYKDNNNNWNFINTNGYQTVTEKDVYPGPDEAIVLNEALTAYEENNDLLNPDGSLNFNNVYGKLDENGNWNFINTNGYSTFTQEELDADTDEARALKEAITTFESNNGLLNPDGSLNLDNVYGAQDGDGNWQFLSTKGYQTFTSDDVTPKPDEAIVLNEALTAYEEVNNLLNPNGSLNLDIVYGEKDADGNWNFINTNGYNTFTQEELDADTDEARALKEALTTFETDNGLLNPDGTLNLDNIYGIQDGDGNWQFLSTKDYRQFTSADFITKEEKTEALREALITYETENGLLNPDGTLNYDNIYGELDENGNWQFLSTKGYQAITKEDADVNIAENIKKGLTDFEVTHDLLVQDPGLKYDGIYEVTNPDGTKGFINTDDYLTLSKDIVDAKGNEELKAALTEYEREHDLFDDKGNLVYDGIYGYQDALGDWNFINTNDTNIYREITKSLIDTSSNESLKEALTKYETQHKLLNDDGSLSYDGIYGFQDSDGLWHFEVNKSSTVESYMKAKDYIDYSPDNGPSYVGNSKVKELNYLIEDKEKGIDQVTDIAQILKDCPDSSINKYASFDASGNLVYSGKGIYTFDLLGTTYYTTEADLIECAQNAQMDNLIDDQYKLAYYSASYVPTKVEETNQALLETGDNGRFKSVKFDNDSVVYNLNVEEVTDEIAYDAAMNDYLYKKAQYEKTIADINAKTSMIQREDRTLELRLKQLDTEQNALATEMDAVKKVIKDNVEKTFKTFSD